MATDLPMARRLARLQSFDLTLTLALAALAPVAAFAQRTEATQDAALHVLFECANSGALKVTCSGALTGGRSAAGLTVRVFDKHGELRTTGKIDPYGRFTFRKPDSDYHVVIETGGGDIVTILGREVT